MTGPLALLAGFFCILALAKLAAGWPEITATFRAPSTARRATVYESCHESCGAGAWIDDLTFSKIQIAPPASSP